MGHDLDLFRSRDVIGHVTIGLPYPISYLCPIVTKPLSAALFEIFDLKVLCAHTDTHTHTQVVTEWIHCVIANQRSAGDSYAYI